MTEPFRGAYRHTIEVLPEDTDELGHVNNVVYLRYIEDVARAHADRVGMTFEVLRQLGAVPVVRRHVVTYRRPAGLGDTLEVSTRIERGRGMRWLRRNEVRRDGELLVEGETEWVWIDPATRRPLDVPEPIREAFGFGG